MANWNYLNADIDKFCWIFYYLKCIDFKWPENGQIKHKNWKKMLQIPDGQVYGQK